MRKNVCITSIKQILSNLAELQGYVEAHFCCAEEQSAL